MVSDLWANLSNGELQAFGKCIAPDISDGPVPIPAHTFDFGPPRDVQFGDEISVAGWHYQFVKVIQIRGADRDNGAELPTETEPSRDVVAAEVEIGLPATPIKKSRGGRYDTYQYSESVLQALRPAAIDPKVSAEQLHADFHAEFVRQYPRENYKITVPNVRTLRTQLIRFRQEPAKIGNN